LNFQVNWTSNERFENTANGFHFTPTFQLLRKLSPKDLSSYIKVWNTSRL
jgi:hypothetical protein